MKAASLTLFFFSILIGNGTAREGVILLHGLCRTSKSMNKMAHTLQEAGYIVKNVSYPSTKSNIRTLANQAIDNSLKDCQIKKCSKIHFVTHSMGGILVRSYLKEKTIRNLGRVVMLCHPNQGSELVDKLGSWKVFHWINGPAGQELGTGENSTPNQLGKLNFECGIITGDRSINWINSIIIPGKDDGKVSVERTKQLGMKDHKVLHVTHPSIMKNSAAHSEVIHFLRSGTFRSS